MNPTLFCGVDPIYFMEGVHPRHNPVAAYGWIKRGTDQTMESNTGRSRVNINGAVDVARLKVVVEFDDAVNAQSTIALLRRLEARHRKAQTIYVYCDNALCTTDTTSTSPSSRPPARGSLRGSTSMRRRFAAC